MNCINPLVGIPYWHQNGSFRYKVIKGAKKYFDDDSCSSLSSRLSLPVCRDPMGNIAHALLLPCGHCMACRLEYSRQWALRMCLERIHHDKENCWFLTLTYDDSHLPKTEKGVSTCRIQDVSDFMKRLRAYYSDTHNLDGIRFYAASEYGDHTFRPHYHLILYGCPVADLQPSEKFGLPAGYFCSKLLNRLWSFGNVMIGQLTFESAAYVSRYVTKKLSGNLYIEKYQKFGIEKESSRMSRNPGIGAFFFDPDIYGDIEKAVGPYSPQAR